MSPKTRLLYAYRVVSRLYFHLPVLFVIFYKRDSSVVQVETLLALYGAAVALVSTVVPAVVRRIGARYAIISGEACKALGLVAIGSGSSYVTEVIGQLLSGIGFSLTTGPDAGLLAALESEQKVRARFQAATQSWMFISVLLAGVAGAVIFSYSSSALVCYLAAGAAAVALCLIVALGRVDSAGGRGSGGREPLRLDGTQRWWATYYVAGRVATLGPFVGFLPYLLFVQLHVKLAFFGTVLGLFSLAAFVSARFASRLTKRYRPGVLIGASVIGAVVAIVAFGVLGKVLGVVLVAIALLGLASGGVRPVTMAGLDGTGLSPAQQGALAGRLEQVTGVCNAVVLVIGGLVITKSFTGLMLGFGGLLLLCGIFLLVTRVNAVPETAAAESVPDGVRS